MSNSFFVSDALKDVIDEQMLTNSSFGLQIQESGETELLGDFVSLSLETGHMTIGVGQGAAKSLLEHPETFFSFSFMGTTWVLSSDDMKLKQDKDGKYHATLRITDRRKEDTYERTV